MTTTTNKPAHVIRLGAIKATIWKEEGKRGSFYSTTVSRTFKRDDDTYSDTNSFSQLELLAVADVSKKAADFISTMTQADA